METQGWARRYLLRARIHPSCWTLPVRRALAEVERLLRVDDEIENLPEHLRTNADALAEALRVPAAALVRLSQGAREKIRPTLRARMASLRQQELEQRLGMARELACLAAARVAQAAIWTDEHIQLDAGLVLGELLVDRTAPFLAFDIEGKATVRVRRARLVDASKALVVFGELTCTLTPKRLAFHWRNGIGQLRFLPQVVTPAEAAGEVVVTLRRPSPLPGDQFVHLDRLARARRWLEPLAASV